MSEFRIEADFSKLDKLVRNLGRRHFVDVGLLGAHGGKTASGGATLAMIGAVHEFGSLTQRIPKRSFIFMPIAAKQSQIQAEVQARMAAHLEEGEAGKIFTDIGISAEARIQEAFDTGGFGTWAPDAPATVAAKGSDSILIDDGSLRKAVSSQAGAAR